MYLVVFMSSLKSWINKCKNKKDFPIKSQSPFWNCTMKNWSICWIHPLLRREGVLMAPWHTLPKYRFVKTLLATFIGVVSEKNHVIALKNYLGKILIYIIFLHTHYWIAFLQRDLYVAQQDLLKWMQFLHDLMPFSPSSYDNIDLIKIRLHRLPANSILSIWLVLKE